MLFLFGGMECTKLSPLIRQLAKWSSYVWGDDVQKAKTQAER